MFHFSALFSATVHAAAFDVAIERDATHGRINGDFAAMLSLHYGFELPAAPVAAVKAINGLLTLDKAPKLASGPGARAAAPAVAQALRSMAEALHAAGRIKGLPALAKLPAWADPEAIAAKAAAAAAAREAAKAVKATAPAVAPTAAPTAATAPAVAPAAPAVAPAAPAVALASAVAMVLAAANSGALSALQIGALRAALDVAQAAPATVPTKRKGGKAKIVPVSAAPVAAPATM